MECGIRSFKLNGSENEHVNSNLRAKRLKCDQDAQTFEYRRVSFEFNTLQEAHTRARTLDSLGKNKSKVQIEATIQSFVLFLWAETCQLKDIYTLKYYLKKTTTRYWKRRHEFFAHENSIFKKKPVTLRRIGSHVLNVCASCHLDYSHGVGHIPFKSTTTFLPPVLFTHWLGCQADAPPALYVLRKTYAKHELCQSINTNADVGINFQVHKFVFSLSKLRGKLLETVQWRYLVKLSVS